MEEQAMQHNSLWVTFEIDTTHAVADDNKVGSRYRQRLMDGLKTMMFTLPGWVTDVKFEKVTDAEQADRVGGYHGRGS
jgi:hypothetical protein